jgi:predicted transcriptional regulator
MLQERDCLLLRLPPALKEQLRDMARVNKRSMTKEIELAVEKHVTQPTQEIAHEFVAAQS